MDSDSTQGYPSEDEGCAQNSRSGSYTYAHMRGSKTHYQNLKSQTNSKLLHLGKILLSHNTPESHKYALEIACIFLNSIPPEGYVPEDLFSYLVSIFHTYFKHQQTDRLFRRFLSITATTTPHLRPLVLEHSVRMLAVKKDVYAIVDEVTRRCNEWNLEIHEVARHYKWAVKHMDTLTNFTHEAVSNEFIVELEHVLGTYLDHRRLPNKNLLSLYVSLCGDKSLELMNRYVSAFPTVYFVRFNRLKILLSTDQQLHKALVEEDLVKFVTLSGYSPLSVELLHAFKRLVPPDRLVKLLFDLVVAVPHIRRNWEVLQEALTANNAQVNAALDAIRGSEIANIFNVHGNIGRRLSPECVDLYLKVASLFVDNKALEKLRLQLDLIF